jgi:hypothetical protein
MRALFNGGGRQSCYDRTVMRPRRTRSLLESSPWLRDPVERADRLLDVAESDGIIEGLPPLTPETRERLHKFLASEIS